jgi:hypothetical protein
LLLKAPEELFKAIKMYDIGVDISPYQPTLRVKDKITEKLEAYGIAYDFEGFEDHAIEKFAKSIGTDGTNNPYMAMKACFSLQCQTLMNGRLYKCPFETFSDRFFQYFKLPYSESERGCDIRSGNIDWKTMMEKLQMEPVDMCRYCSSKVEYFDWETVMKPELTDWIVCATTESDKNV